MRRCTALLVICLAVGGGACGGGEEPPAKVAPGSVELRVMSFNIWYGGVSVDFGQIAAAIRAADADIVGVQEPEGNLRRLADAAGLPYVDESLHLISRFPLFAVERGGVRFAYAEVARDRVVAIENVHLTCCPYGPNLVKAGKPAEDVIALERRVRLPEAEEYVDALAPLIDDDVPLFVTGDFNSPSHLDWTAAATEARDLPYPLEWPASKAFADAGFRDSYRDAHPDPAAEPGLTWTAGQPPPRMRPSETNDRIDWVLAAGPSETLSSGVVGEDGGPGVEVGVSPWGSDHRAVVSSFAAEPAPAPYLVSAEPRVVEAGSRVTLRYALAAGGPGRVVGIVAGSDPEGEALQTIPIYDASDHIAPMLGTAGLAPGRYSAVLLERGGKVLAASPFWIAARDSRPAIATAQGTYAPGEPIAVRWSGAPGNKLDYVAIFKAGDPSVYGYLGYLYTDARPDGELEFTKGDTGRLAPGRYFARLMLDDGYSVLAGAPFTVAR
ncbi:MAG: endonuclease/exonuclease/phosphatase family protein [Vicinamibacteria bacterium]